MSSVTGRLAIRIGVCIRPPSGASSALRRHFQLSSFGQRAGEEDPPAVPVDRARQQGLDPVRDLPGAVLRYLRAAIGERVPVVRSAVLSGHGHLQAMRYRSAADLQKIPWFIEPLAWQTFDGMRLPSRVAVTGQDEGTPWLVMMVEDAAYNVDVPPPSPRVRSVITVDCSLDWAALRRGSAHSAQSAVQVVHRPFQAGGGSPIA